MSQAPYNTEGIENIVTEVAPERAKNKNQKLEKNSTPKQVFSIFDDKLQLFDSLVAFL